MSTSFKNYVCFIYDTLYVIVLSLLPLKKWVFFTYFGVIIYTINTYVIEKYKVCGQQTTPQGEVLQSTE